MSETRQPWELTDEEVAEAKRKARQPWRAEIARWCRGERRRWPYLRDFEDAAIASAAVQKVAEWMEAHDIASRRTFVGTPAEEADVLLDKGDLWVDRLDWQALKGVSK